MEEIVLETTSLAVVMDQTEARTAALEQKVNRQEKGLVELQARLESVRKHNDHLVEEVRSEQVKASRFEQELLETRKLLEEKYKAVEMLQSSIVRLEQDVSAHQRVVAFQSEIIEGKELRLKDLQEKSKTKQAVVSDLQSRLDEALLLSQRRETETILAQMKSQSMANQIEGLNSMLTQQQRRFGGQVSSMASTIEVLSTSLASKQDFDTFLSDHDAVQEEQEEENEFEVEEKLASGVVDSSMKELSAENIQLSRQKVESERVNAAKISELITEIVRLGRVCEVERVEKTAVQEDLAQAKEESRQLMNELKKLNEKSVFELINSSDSSSANGINGMTSRDVSLLKRAYIEEVRLREVLQKQLETLLKEIREKQPVLQRQNMKWTQLNVEFISIEASARSNILKLEAAMSENLALQSQLDTTRQEEKFLKEEISRLASQIQHLLKVNFKLKQHLSSKLGRTALEEIMNAIRLEKSEVLMLAEVDTFYGSQATQEIYSDLQDIVQTNIALAKKLQLIKKTH